MENATWDATEFLDEYDPLAGGDEDDAPETPLPAQHAEVPGAGNAPVAGDAEEAAEAGEVSAQQDDEERLNAFLESMDTRRKVLLGIIALCREPIASDELMAKADELQARNQSVFASSTLCELLAKAGGLRHVNADGSDFDGGEGAQDAVSEAAAEAESGASGDAGEPPAVEPAAPAEAAPDADGRAGDEEDFEVEYLEVEQPRQSFWVATEAGLAVLDADDPRSRLEQLLADDAYYLPVYREILEALADAPMTKAQLDGIVRNHPLTQDMRAQTGYFLDRLERTDAIAWESPWAITELGRDILKDEALYQ